MKYSFKNKIKIINMGGEQFAILIYGPKINLSYDEWVNKFNLINKKEWVRNFSFRRCSSTVRTGC
jgi:hypothetical protein